MMKDIVGNIVQFKDIEDGYLNMIVKCQKYLDSDQYNTLQIFQLNFEAMICCLQ